jgi:hypothetical protein
MEKKLAIKSCGSGYPTKNSKIISIFLALLAKNKILNAFLLKIITQPNLLIFNYLLHIPTSKC